MPVHALLGATGATGAAVLRDILSSHNLDLQLNILVRSKQKLLEAFPRLEDNDSCTIRIFTADVSDKKTLVSCLRNATVVYCCISTNKSLRGTTIARSSASAIVAAIRQLQVEQIQQYQTPLLVINRSMVLNPSLESGTPRLIEKFLEFTLGYLFADLRAACEIYRSTAHEDIHPRLLSYVFVDAPGLHNPQGTEQSGHKLVSNGKLTPSLNYADLGAAFVEIAARRDEFQGKAVGVSAAGKVNESIRSLLFLVLTGLKERLKPF